MDAAAATRESLTDENGEPIPAAYERAFQRGQFGHMLASFCHEGGLAAEDGASADGHLCSWGTLAGENPDREYTPTGEEYGRAVLARIQAGWGGC